MYLLVHTGWLVGLSPGWLVCWCVLIFYLFGHVVRTVVLILSLRLGSIESECSRYARCAHRDQDQAEAG